MAGKERLSEHLILGEEPNSALVLLSVPKTDLILQNQLLSVSPVNMSQEATSI